MTKHYGTPDPAAPAPPTWQQTPRAVPPQLGGTGPSTPPTRNGSYGNPTSAAPAPAAPQQQAGPRTSRLGRAARRWRLLVVAMVPCLVLAGVGWWAWPSQPAPIPLHLVAGTVQADLLSPDEVSRLAGTALVSGPRSNQPPTAMSAGPSPCAVAVGPATQSVYGHTWTAFLSATYQDAGGTGAYTVNQVIGVFPDGAKAAEAFQSLTTGLAHCPSSTRTDQAGRTTIWAYTAAPPTPVALAWTAAQGGGAGWACYHQARLKGTSLVQVAVCEAGDGRPTTTKLADTLTGQVSG